MVRICACVFEDRVSMEFRAFCAGAEFRRATSKSARDDGDESSFDSVPADVTINHFKSKSIKCEWFEEPEGIHQDPVMKPMP
jgi:hypothetical protein